ncbi:DUF4293 domain-containing protein [Taibaiella koreensis]|uniref:DUF4293 domain-containing protein n=1 Tax=Taibaiella koreensis TaxID=1268548 RepID=UPI000E59ECB9|nr:DUF4293 domain-containing protein [Taibaiella koreensis]
MIQRIQSLWLLLAAIVMATIFYFPTYVITGTTTAQNRTVGNDPLAIILAVLSIILSLVVLFRFKNRKSQLSLTWINILACVGLQAWLFIGINNFRNTPEMAALPGHYWVGTFLPLVTLLLLFMARAGIRKDEKLVKSLDRLR